MRSDLIRALAAVLLAGFPVSAWSGSVAPPKPLTIAHIAPLGGAQDVAARAFAAYLEQALPHRFSIDVRGGQTVGNEPDIDQSVRAGVIDIGICTTSSFGAAVPGFAVLDLPFLFRDQAHAAAVLDGPIGESLGQNLARLGLTHLAFGELGFRHMTNARHPIRVPADLAGLKMRTGSSDIAALAFRTLGVQPVKLPVGELYASLRDGRIDGQENPVLVIQVFRFHEVQKYLSLTGHFYTVLDIFVNAGTLEDMAPDEHAAVRAAARAAAEASRKANAADERRAIAGFRAEGVEVTEDFDRAAFLSALAPAQAEFDRRFGADLIARIRAVK
jgi:tripartite ATP-independent transporter DctP family solute receptor